MADTMPLCCGVVVVVTLINVNNVSIYANPYANHLQATEQQQMPQIVLCNFG